MGSSIVYTLCSSYIIHVYTLCSSYITCTLCSGCKLQCIIFCIMQILILCYALSLCKQGIRGYIEYGQCFVSQAECVCVCTCMYIVCMLVCVYTCCIICMYNIILLCMCYNIHMVHVCYVATNAASLGRYGCVSVFPRLLTLYGSKDYHILRCVQYRLALPHSTCRYILKSYTALLKYSMYTAQYHVRACRERA